jgi:phage terminase large subunit
MTISMQSLRALPPKQALALALAERARRERIKRTRVQLLESASVSREDEDKPPEITHGATSLVLDREHPLSDLYYKKARYKVYWGGRGSAKSWGVAEALIRLAASLPIRVLCLREFQNSIRESSHKILSDTIERLGLQSWFTVGKESITSRAGAEFIFKGCYGKLNSVRSTEGIDICWVEEAHSVAEASWRVIIPTIRKEGSEIWITFNMDDENDATYRRFVATPRPNSIVHLVNYDSNPYFSAVLREEMEFDRETDYQLYEHIWLGKPKRISNAIILNKKYVVRAFDDELWRDADRPRYGADFGFSQDPSTLMRMFVLREKAETETGIREVKRLYISHEAYGTGVELDEMPEFYDAVPGSREWPIAADCSRPETISHLKGKGFGIYGAEKWDGSVKDGIAHLRSYYEIVIHPRCKEAAREAHLWRYKVDPKIVDEHGQPLVLPVVVDKHNHTWDGVRYGLDGEILRGGALGIWSRLGAPN